MSPGPTATRRARRLQRRRPLTDRPVPGFGLQTGSVSESRAGGVTDRAREMGSSPALQGTIRHYTYKPSNKVSD